MHITRTFSIFSLCLILFSALPGFLSSATAQQQEKRIALVVGNGAYAKSPLATAANDAGLIAQTLQAAGFDVVGARDLDGATLRASFRDFVQKAQASGSGTVAMVYLAGYGMQLAGENYFIPVDSSLSRDVDIPIEGLRIGDYLRQLASLPLKASIVVLDAARQQPFVQGGQPIASGLALVEPDPHMLVAFNAAPGTIAPNEPGPYGVYAQSLAEMIRTGGLPLPEVFRRVRLRVNDASKGAQVPWDAQKIDAQFMFFDRAPDAPAQAPPDQVAAIRDKPIRDLGAQDAYAAALERDSMQGYEDFLAAYPADPLAKRVRAIVAARREAITWLRTYRADTPQAYWSYLRRYPRGPHASDARRRLAILTAPLEPPPSFAVFDYDVPPPPPDEFVYVDRPVLMFSDPEFDFAPPPPPPFYFCPPPPPDFVVLPPPFVPIGLFILPQPVFVPIPVFVQPPVYIAPPPNNIIFANIHNTTVINNVINQPPAPPAAPGTPVTPPNAKGGAAQGVITPVSTGAQVQTPTPVTRKALAIQRGEEPPPKSALINPAAKQGATGAPSGQKGAPNPPLQTNVAPTNVTPGAVPPGHELPKTIPDTKLVPQTQPGAKPATGGPNAPAPLVGQPKAGGSAQAPELKPVVPETKPVVPGTNPVVPGTNPVVPGTNPVVPGTNPVVPGTNPVVPGTNPVVPGTKQKSGAVPPSPPPSKPAAAAAKPVPPAPPKPEIRRAEPPRRAAPPPPPPRPAPQVARPAPPPPRAAAPPPRPAPPPPPRPAPQVARPAPPPPRPAPPPARPAAPAAAKKCPPNVPKC